MGSFSQVLESYALDLAILERECLLSGGCHFLQMGVLACAFDKLCKISDGRIQSVAECRSITHRGHLHVVLVS